MGNIIRDGFAVSKNPVLVASTDKYNIWKDLDEMTKAYQECNECLPEDEDTLLDWINEETNYRFNDFVTGLSNQNGVAVAYGTFGRWNGPQVHVQIGDIEKVINKLSDVSCCMVDTDLYWDDRTLQCVVSHHDGTNYYHIKLLTPQGEKWYNNNKEKYNTFDLVKHLWETKGYTKNFSKKLKWY